MNKQIAIIYVLIASMILNVFVSNFLCFSSEC